MIREVSVKIALSCLFVFVPPLFVSANSHIPPPVLVYPTEDSLVWKGVVEFTWESTNAPFYEYFISLPSGQGNTGITGSTFYRTYDLELGSHRWSVRSCSNQEGTDAHCGAYSEVREFEIVSPPPELLGGLQICARAYDNPATPFEEHEPCKLKHLGLLLQHVLDFVLWKVSLFMLVVLAMIAGVTSYFSFGSPNTVARIHAIFRSFFVGFLLAMFAWLLVNVVMVLFGFQFEFFGRWWEIST